MWKREFFFGLLRRSLLVVLIFCGLLGIIGSSISDDDDKKKSPDPSDEVISQSVSKSVRTNQSYTLKHDSGAEVYIPLRAVPATEDNFIGAMTFSIESDAIPPSTDVAGGMTLGTVYRFGPSGFVFARPVKVTLPVSDPEANGLTLMVYDEIQTLWIPVPSEIDQDNQRISAYTQHFSYWAVGYWTDPSWNAGSAYGWGALNGETPASVRHVYSVCIESHSLTYPDIDGAVFDSSLAMMTADRSRCGMRLPQGIYTLGVTAWDPGTGRLIGHQILGNYTIDAYDAGLRWNEGAHIEHWPTEEFQPGMGCFLEPTSSPGIGEVQVTLAWRSSSPADLDLHVTDPKGETVFFGNPRSESGGLFDQDNRCVDFVLEQPETVYWLGDAPIGEYVVHVVYLSDCLNSPGEIDFDVRIVNKGVTERYDGTVTAVGETVEVVRFTVR